MINGLMRLPNWVWACLRVGINKWPTTEDGRRVVWTEWELRREFDYKQNREWKDAGQMSPYYEGMVVCHVEKKQ